LTPLAGAVLVWLSFRIGRRLGGSWAGAIAAVLVATTPIVLFQVVQPMNDVFVTALWTGTVAALTAGERRRVTVAGALAGAALLVRPNLLPVGVVVAAWLFLTGRADDAVAPLKGGARAVARFGLGAVPFGLVVLWLNHALYGGAFRSGYGNPADLFAWSHVSANAALHVRAIVETQAGLPLLGFAAPWMLRGARREAMLAWLVAAAVIVCYLPYQPFPEWWYVRFLMPALVLLVMLSVAVASRFALAAWGSGVGAWGVAMRVGLLGGATLLGVYQVRVAGERGTFDLQRMESRYRHVGEAMLDHLPPATVALSVWNSGSVRFHGRREAVLWDSLDPAWMDRAAAWLLAQGRPPVIVVERWEEPQFRARFGARSSIGALDWPPRIDVDGLIRIYDPADRVRYLAGQQVETTIVAPRR
jgi:hypothetical protein